MTKRIALIGSAPSSVALAPYDDPTWTVWSCSPGARPYLKRIDMHFEMHLWEPQQPWFAPEYVDWMAKLSVPVMMLEPIAVIPNSVAYPKNEILARYGVEGIWFFTSSLAWMIALAIESGADEIGLWGVDMSAAEEIYSGQRSGCQYFIGKALARGIKVTVPQQSDLMRPTPLYGYCELDGMHQKLLAREAELNNRLVQASNTFEAARQEMLYLRGAAEDVKYSRQTFVHDRQAMDILAAAGAPQTIVLSSHLAASGPAPQPVTAEPELDFKSGGELLPVPTVTWASTTPPHFVNGALG